MVVCEVQIVWKASETQHKASHLLYELNLWEGLEAKGYEFMQAIIANNKLRNFFRHVVENNEIYLTKINRAFKKKLIDFVRNDCYLLDSIVPLKDANSKTNVTGNNTG